MKKSTHRNPVLAPRPSIGIDLGGQTSMACFLRRDGQVEWTAPFGTTPEGVTGLMEDLEPTVIVLEACGFSGWVVRLLESLGHEVVMVNPKRLKLIAESTLKTDTLDAQTLARLARLHQLDDTLVPRSQVRSRDTQIRKHLLSVRDQLVETRKRFVTLVRHTLRAHAVRAPSCKAEAFLKHMTRLEIPQDVREAIQPLLAALEEINRQVTAATDKLRRVARQMPIVRACCEIDGVGELTALALALTIEDPQRFPRPRDVGPYIGFTPVLRQSSESEQRGACSKKGDPRTRQYLVQAAHCLMRSKHDSALRRWALALVARRGYKKAAVALARKLAIVMQALWLRGEPYHRFPSEPVVAG